MASGVGEVEGGAVASGVVVEEDDRSCCCGSPAGLSLQLEEDLESCLQPYRGMRRSRGTQDTEG